MNSNKAALSISMVSLVLAVVALGKVILEKPSSFPTYGGVNVEGVLTADTVMADKIMVRGPNDHYLVYLGPDTESKAGSIRIADAEGREIAAILRSIDSGGGWLHLSGTELGSKVVLCVDQNEEGSLWLVAKDPKETIMLSPHFERVLNSEAEELPEIPAPPAGNPEEIEESTGE